MARFACQRRRGPRAEPACVLDEPRSPIRCLSLSKLYRFGDFVIVGGAFRGTLHNTLEPAVYGVPVFFGSHPNNEKFVEARELQTVGGGFTFEDFNDLKVQLDQMLKNQRMYEIACVASAEFVQSRAGASKKIMARMKEVL